jgi:hypothetical protein
MNTENNDRQALLEEAKQLGLEFPPNITAEKLGTMITKAKAPVGAETIEVPVDVIKQLQAQIDELKAKKLPTNTDDTVDALVHALNVNAGNNGVKISKGIAIEDTPNKGAKIERALTLIRCTVIPRDPSKVNQKAEVITMSNDLVGDLRYKVPFNLETHIPLAIYKILEAKKINIFDDTLASGNKQTGETMGGYKSIDAYSINILPKLTPAELKALGRKQRLRGENLDDREDAILDEEAVEEEAPKSKLEQMGYDL